MSVNDLLMSNYFYSNAEEVPEGLRLLDKKLVHFDAKSLSMSSDVEGLLWFRLTSDQTISEQLVPVLHRFPHCKLVVMSDLPNDLEALAAFSISAKAYCNSHAGIEVLRNILGVVSQGGVWIGESIMNRLLAQQLPEVKIKQVVTDKWDALLTLREKEVAVQIATGLQNRQIAENMKITERTVKAHVGAILEKLHLKNRLQLALLVKES